MNFQNEFIVHPSAEVDSSAVIGQGTKIWHYAQVREGAEIGKECIIGKGVYIGVNVKVGDRCKIQNYACLYAGVTLGDGVFIGPHACLINDPYPRATISTGELKGTADWLPYPIQIEDGVSIGANATILPGVTIMQGAMIGAGAVVTKNVPASATVIGNPAKEKE